MCSSNTLYTNPKPCKHLADYKVKNGLCGYNGIQDYFRTTPYGRTTLEMSNSEIPRCSICSRCRGKFYMCLICSSVLCCLSPESNHALLHRQSQSGYEISVDMERAELYCSVCCDQVYDPDFDKAVMCTHIMGFPRTENGAAESELRLSKRRRLSFGMDLDSKNMKRLFFRRDQKSKSCFPLGLRGLNNLGNTCFMNSVFWWQHSENLATYEQQDAHEYFISMLDRIHDKEGKTSLAIKDNGDCQCVAHRVFSGLLRSDVICASCGFTSTTHDPCIDISLDLNACNSSRKDFANKSSKPNESLVGCLGFFTRPEKLGSNQKLYCENCQEKQDALKQMSIKKLPLVLCFHIK